MTSSPIPDRTFVDDLKRTWEWCGGVSGTWMWRIVALPQSALTDRMREAACVLEDATKRHHRQETFWTAKLLRTCAAEWDAEDKAREQQLDDLTAVLHKRAGGSLSKHYSRELAQAIIAAGWSKK